MKLRNTIQKDLILAAVRALCHPTADDVYRYVASTHPSISKGTVYRNLGGLVEQGVLRKVNLSDGPDCFDITLHDHYHVRCKACGKVDDIDLPVQNELIAGIGDACGYLIEGHEITLKGLCPACRAG